MTSTRTIIGAVLVGAVLVAIAMTFALGGTLGVKRGVRGRPAFELRPPTPSVVTAPVAASPPPTTLVGTGSIVAPYVASTGGTGAPL